MTNHANDTTTVTQEEADHGDRSVYTAPRDVQATRSSAEPSTSATKPANHIHRWMMLVMCLPVVVLGIWALAAGAGAGPLISALACVVMMGAMHLLMKGPSGHHH